MNVQEKHLEYLFRSFQHHPSPYVIYDLDGSIRWANIAAKYIFRIKEFTDLSIKVPEDGKENINNEDGIASSYNTPIEVELRKIKFLMRTRVHLIPVENSDGFLLIEILCFNQS